MNKLLSISVALFLVVLASCKSSNRLPATRCNCHKMNDLELAGYAKDVRGVRITHGQAMVKDGEWQIDSSGQMMTWATSIGDYGYFIITNVNANETPLYYIKQRRVEDSLIIFESFVRPDNELAAIDTLKWTDSCHAVKKYYDVYDSGSVRLAKVEHYAFDEKCRVTRMELTEYDTSGNVTKKLQRNSDENELFRYVLPGNYSLLDRVTVLERDKHRNPVKLMVNCDGCKDTTLIVQQFIYGK